MNLNKLVQDYKKSIGDDDLCLAALLWLLTFYLFDFLGYVELTLSFFMTYVVSCYVITCLLWIFGPFLYADDRMKLSVSEKLSLFLDIYVFHSLMCSGAYPRMWSANYFVYFAFAFATTVKLSFDHLYGKWRVRVLSNEMGIKDFLINLSNGINSDTSVICIWRLEIFGEVDVPWSAKIWNYFTFNVGHSSMRICMGNGEKLYLSRWPKAVYEGSILNPATVEARVSSSLQEDIEAEGRNPDVLIFLPKGFLDEENIRQWFNQQQENGYLTYNLIHENCSRFIKDAFRAGGKGLVEGQWHLIFMLPILFPADLAALIVETIAYHQSSAKLFYKLMWAISIMRKVHFVGIITWFGIWLALAPSQYWITNPLCFYKTEESAKKWQTVLFDQDISWAVYC